MLMQSLTLKQLRYVDALARQGHFGRAAELCSVSQPALSMQIRDLEAALGTDLFERGPREVRLTRFGEAFSAPIDAVLGWIGDNRPWVLALTVGLVVIGGLVQLRRGGGEIGQLRRLEHDLHADGGESATTDASAATDTTLGSGPAADTEGAATEPHRHPTREEDPT